jgi:hypothetical protein
VTLVTYRCVPEGGRSRPRPPTVDELLGDRPAPSTGFVQAALDTYRAAGRRPPWLTDGLLGSLERGGSVIGTIYLLHFDQAIGDVFNPRGYARHYTGWTLDLPARLAAHAAGKSRHARLMEVVYEAGIGWQLARTWTGPRARERSFKQSGAARRCPVCKLAKLRLAPNGRPLNPLALELGHRAAAFATPVPLIQPPAGVMRPPPAHARQPGRRDAPAV